MSDEEIKKLLEKSYNGPEVEGYYIKTTLLVDSECIVYEYKELLPTEETTKKIIENKISELRLKLVLGTITAEEKEELKLLVG